MSIYVVEGVYDDRRRFDVSVIVPMYRSKNAIYDQIFSWTLESGIDYEIIYVEDQCPEKSRQAVFYAWEHRKDQRTLWSDWR